MIDPLQQTQQTLHTPTPFVQDIVRVPWFREANDSGGPVDLCINRLCRDEFADVLLRLIFVEVEKLCQPAHLDSGIVLRDHPDIVLDNSLAKILPSLERLLVTRLVRFGVKDVCAAQVRPKFLCYHGPTHDFMNGEELEKLGFEGYLGIARISLNPMKEVGLFVVVWGKDDVEDDSLQNLEER